MLGSWNCTETGIMLFCSILIMQCLRESAELSLIKSAEYILQKKTVGNKEMYSLLYQNQIKS